jgi:hypothetical protein
MPIQRFELLWVAISWWVRCRFKLSWIAILVRWQVAFQVNDFPHAPIPRPVPMALRPIAYRAGRPED